LGRYLRGWWCVYTSWYFNNGCYHVCVTFPYQYYKFIILFIQLANHITGYMLYSNTNSCVSFPFSCSGTQTSMQDPRARRLPQFYIKTNLGYSIFLLVVYTVSTPPLCAVYVYTSIHKVLSWSDSGSHGTVWKTSVPRGGGCKSNRMIDALQRRAPHTVIYNNTFGSWNQFAQLFSCWGKAKR